MIMAVAVVSINPVLAEEGITVTEKRLDNGDGEITVADNGKPNVILIMTDDQGYGDLSCHGNPVLKTPNLDRLHSESTRFTDFHVAPFCSPTRAALMTGRLPERGNVWETVYDRNHLDRSETTMAEFFKASGYATGQFGKWHLGSNYPYRPMDRGFDQWLGVGDTGLQTADDWWANDRMNDHFLRNGEWESTKGFGADFFFDETMSFIKDNEEKPFFAYLATNTPHWPNFVPKEWDNPYQNPELKGYHVGDFLRTIARIDYNMGRLRDFLDKHDLTKNTILIFLTDNGTGQGQMIFNDGMRGKKGSPYDGGHRVPCFIHWPAGGFVEPRDIDDLTSCTDLLPTLIDLCGLNTPKRGHQPLDGKSLVPLLAGETTPWNDRTLIHHQQNCCPKAIKWANSVVLTPKWRLINGRELYDIEKDPSQRNNIAEKHPDVVADLRSRYETYWAELKTDEQLKNPARPIIGSDHQKETWLTCIDWIRDNNLDTWDQSHVLAGVRGSGYWPVEIAVAGKYRFEVRRWPREVNKPITAALPAQTKSDTTLNSKPWAMGAGKGIPAIKVKLKVGQEIVEKSIADNDTFTEFSLDLPRGNTQIQAWLINKDQKAQGAYYVYVKKL